MGGIPGAGAASRQRIAVVPAFNEVESVIAVLDDVAARMDRVIVIDDGSTDGTSELLVAWTPEHPNVHLIRFAANRGVSAAYRAALDELDRCVIAHEADPDDLVFFIDADGQHDLAELDRLEAAYRDDSLDALIARRDLGYQRAYKRLGNHIMSAWASLWAGRRLADVECGYRIYRLGPLLDSMRYVRGFRYSQPAQMAVVLGRLGYRMRNDLVVNVPVVRSRTKLRNAVLHLIAIPWSAFRVLLGPLGRNSRSERDTATKPRPIWTRAEQLAATAVAGIGVGTIVRIAIRGSITLGAVSVLLGVLGFTIPFRREPTAFGRGLALVLTPIEFGLAGVLWGQSMLACLASFGAGATVGLLVAPTSAIAATLPAGPRRPRRYGWVIVAPVAVFWAVAVAWSGANNPAAAWFGHTTSHGTRGSDAVAITFDDGPNDTNTAAISDLFASRGAKATFFMVGSAVEARPELARRLAAQGQVIGNHSYRHGPDDWMDPAYPELRRGESAFARVIGRCPRFFRPPFGRHTPAMAEHVEQMGMQMITWDVSASDWTTRDPALIAHRILHRVKPGSIVLLHDGSNGRPSVDRAFMVQAVTLVLDGLESRNLHPVGLDDLLHQTAWLPSCPAS